jgi:hypothetical protein
MLLLKEAYKKPQNNSSIHIHGKNRIVKILALTAMRLLANTFYLRIILFQQKEEITSMR